MLSGPHQKFAEGIARGLSAFKAYREAYPDSSAESADGNAHRLKGNEGIIMEIQRLRREAQLASGGTVLTMADKRKFIFDLINTPIAEITPESRLCQSYKRSRKVTGRGEDAEEWETEEFKVPDKLKALEIDNECAAKEEASFAAFMSSSFEGEITNDEVKKAVIQQLLEKVMSGTMSTSELTGVLRSVTSEDKAQAQIEKAQMETAEAISLILSESGKLTELRQAAATGGVENIRRVLFGQQTVDAVKAGA